MAKGQFDRPQNDHIESFFPEFAKELDRGVDGAALTKWKQAKASSIMESPAFTNLDLKKNPRKAWFEVSVLFASTLTRLNDFPDDCPEVHELSEPGLPQVCDSDTNPSSRQQESEPVAQIFLHHKWTSAICQGKLGVHHGRSSSTPS
jgi:hypothetical protein